ncbi:Rod shape-determining protein MreD [Rhodovulum sp. P5]|uniref:hypothetical protein n=1 Tax=Rhodovulum sp. P5 TaxID=1564506 RepID=UPI0009C397B0|nr:hypothetical protein [Rhodovulum sp. P5]ARE41091.1 Rod shape-determining protein MreD [Rhodovulum sp. P5]
MVDPLTLERWIYRSVFCLWAAVFAVVMILPLETRPGRLPGPEWMLCLTFAWLQRRPDFVPAWLIAGVFLSLDMLLMRPPGLMTAFVLLGSEFLRSRQYGTGEMTFGTEWLTAAAAIVAVFLCDGLVLGLFAVPEADFGRQVVQAVLTVLAYPFIAALSHYGFRVQRQTPGTLSARGMIR